jgi:beta-phosphoglucomutase-like phosphatase (HAD superfamily)
MSDFDAIIFDCDGVLVDSETLALDIELEELAGLGLHYDRAAYCARFMGMNNKDFYAALDADRVERVGENLPESFITAQRERMLAACRDRLEEVAGAGRAARACTPKKAVASSSGSTLLRIKLEATGLWEIFAPHVYGGDMVNRGKPAPDIFLLAAKGLGVDPLRCVVIEDTENGVRAACAAGMTAWAFTGGGHMSEEDAGRLTAAGARRAFSSWDELHALFCGWTRDAILRA